MKQKVAVVVDAISSGTLLSPAFRAYGYSCVHVKSSANVLATSPMVPADNDFVATYDVAAIGIEGVERELANFDLDFVIAGTDSGIGVADLLSERLKLPQRNDFALSKARRDKFLMVERLRETNLPAPRQFKAGCLQEAMENLANVGSFPVIVKPARSYGTDGVTVCTAIDQYTEAVRNALVRTERYSEGNRYAVIQEYLQGHEYQVDTVSCGGLHKIIAIWSSDRNRHGSPFPYKATLVSMQKDEYREITSYVKSVLSVLGVVWGPANTEVMLTASGPKLIELNARLQGTLDSLPVSLAIGTNQALETVKAYIDPDGFSRGAEEPTRLRSACAKVCLISPLRGVLKQEPRWELLEELPSYRGAVKKYYVGKAVTPTVDMLTTPAIVFLNSNSEEQLMKDYARIRELEKDGFYHDLV